ncbi:MAG: hypothetical protein K6G61_03345 [Solobacterium sp.]|nr:hypothetical protein [Solobacterium sp.]
MKKRRFAMLSAAGFLTVLFLLSILITKLEIEESYAVIHEHGLTGTPMPFGIFLFGALLWIASLVLFVIIDAVHALLTRSEEAFFTRFFLDLAVFAGLMLLYWPLLLGAAWIGALLVDI